MKKQKLSGFYIQNEAKKGFRHWTKSALEFTLKNYKLSEEIQEQIQIKIKHLED